MAAIKFNQLKKKFRANIMAGLLSGCSFFFFGCAPTQTLIVQHLIGASENAPAVFSAAQFPILIITQKNKTQQNPFRSGLVAEKFNEVLQKADLSLSSAFVSTDPAFDRVFIDYLNPSGIVYFDWENWAVLQSSLEEPLNPVAPDESAVSDNYTTRIDARYTLRWVRYPEGKNIASTSGSASLSEKTSEPVDRENWIKENEELFLDQIIDQIKPKLTPFKIESQDRPLYYDPADKDSTRAFSAAMEGEWETAIKIWELRTKTGEGGWREWFNLGAAYEKTKDLKKALVCYQQARTMAIDQKDSGGVDWEMIFNSLQNILIRPATDSAESQWYKEALLMLPFETVGRTESARFVRNQIRSGLEKSGYNILSSTQTQTLLFENDRFQKKGLTEVNPEVLAAELNVPRLFLGKISREDLTFKACSGCLK